MMPAHWGILNKQYLGRTCHRSFSTEHYIVTMCVNLLQLPKMICLLPWLS